jgi:hypothetical protein
MVRSPEKVSVGGLDVSVSLDQGLPLLDHRPQLVRREVHAVEVGQAVLALNILAQKLELLERPLGVLKMKIFLKAYRLKNGPNLTILGYLHFRLFLHKIEGMARLVINRARLVINRIPAE